MDDRAVEPAVSEIATLQDGIDTHCKITGDTLERRMGCARHLWNVRTQVLSRNWLMGMLFELGLNRPTANAIECSMRMRVSNEGSKYLYAFPAPKGEELQDRLLRWIERSWEEMQLGDAKYYPESDSWVAQVRTVEIRLREKEDEVRRLRLAIKILTEQAKKKSFADSLDACVGYGFGIRWDDADQPRPPLVVTDKSRLLCLTTVGMPMDHLSAFLRLPNGHMIELVNVPIELGERNK